MLLALALTTLSVFVEEEHQPPAPTSRWGVAAGTGFRFGTNRGVNLAVGPRFALTAPPQPHLKARYITPALAFLFEGELGLTRGVGAFGAEVRLELMLAPQGGLLVPWALIWLGAGAGAAWLGGPATELFHLGVGIGGNAFADGGAWGPHHSWADWMEDVTWPLVLLGTLAGLPLAMLRFEFRVSFYPSVTQAQLWPSLLVGFGM